MNATRTCLHCHGENVPLLADYCPRCGSDDLSRVDPPAYMLQSKASQEFLSLPTPVRKAMLGVWVLAAVTTTVWMIIWTVGLHEQCENLTALQRLYAIWNHLPALFWLSLAVTLLWLLLIPLSDWVRGSQN